MKNMFYELPVIHVGAGIHTEAVESSLCSQACPSRSSRPTVATEMPRAVGGARKKGQNGRAGRGHGATG